MRDIYIANEELEVLQSIHHHCSFLLILLAVYQNYMQEMICLRRGSEKKEERHDLFSSLLDASDGEADGAAKLSDREMLGNIFVFLLAGHEVRLFCSP